MFYPFFPSAADWAFRDVPYGYIKVWGTILIMLGFIVMLVPEQWQEKVTCWKEGSCPCERSIMDMDQNRVNDRRRNDHLSQDES